MSENGNETTDWKTLIFNVFNLFFLLIGAANLLTFFYEVQMGSHYINLFYSTTYFSTLYVLLIASCLMLFASILGLIATKRKQTVLLYIYMMILILIILFELVVVTTSYIYATNTETILKHELNITFLDHYEKTVDKSVSIDFVQQSEECCGIYSYSDWDSSWWLQQDNVLNKVPDSCCKSLLPKCGMRAHPSNIYYKGCLGLVKKRILHYLQVLLVVSLGSFTIPIFGIIFSIKLYLTYRMNKYDTERDSLRQWFLFKL